MVVYQETGQPGRVTAFAKGVKDIGVSAGKGIGGFISGILKGIGGGLTAIANPFALIGLAVVSAAILAILLHFVLHHQRLNQSVN